MVWAGDNIDYDVTGPNFLFRDGNIVYDLELTGPDIPDYVREGQESRFTAEVVEYEENSPLFLLDPVSTEVR